MPSAPPAPARFSTTTGCLSSRASASATGRATVSATPPGGNGTIIVIVFSGQLDCANAAAATTSVATTSERDRVRQTRMQGLRFFAHISIGKRTGDSMITLTGSALVARSSMQLLLGTLIALAAPFAAAQDYPNKPVR